MAERIPDTQAYRGIDALPLDVVLEICDYLDLRTVSHFAQCNTTTWDSLQLYLYKRVAWINKDRYLESGEKPVERHRYPTTIEEYYRTPNILSWAICRALPARSVNLAVQACKAIYPLMLDGFDGSGRDSRPPLFYAVTMNKRDVVALLEENGANLNMRFIYTKYLNFFCCDRLGPSCWSGPHKGGDCDSSSVKYQGQLGCESALMMAVRRLNLELTLELVRKTDVAAHPSALYIAVRMNWIPGIAAIIESGRLDPTALPLILGRALHECAGRYILSRSSDPYIVDQCAGRVRWTRYTREQFDEQCLHTIDFLVSKGADLDARFGDHRETVLEHAIRHRKCRIAQYLFAATIQPCTVEPRKKRKGKLRHKKMLKLLKGVVTDDELLDLTKLMVQSLRIDQRCKQEIFQTALFGLEAKFIRRVTPPPSWKYPYQTLRFLISFFEVKPGKLAELALITGGWNFLLLKGLDKFNFKFDVNQPVEGSGGKSILEMAIQATGPKRARRWGNPVCQLMPWHPDPTLLSKEADAKFHKLFPECVETLTHGTPLPQELRPQPHQRYYWRYMAYWRHYELAEDQTDELEPDDWPVSIRHIECEEAC
ncbi:hypothetical protein F5B20DRAFT_575756 [Whalleya microplaca]|nr:hypothetical protein F5B20DRAFT_575756 [Whalleya microplaca]